MISVHVYGFVHNKEVLFFTKKCFVSHRFKSFPGLNLNIASFIGCGLVYRCGLRDGSHVGAEPQHNSGS